MSAFKIMYSLFRLCVLLYDIVDDTNQGAH